MLLGRKEKRAKQQEAGQEMRRRKKQRSLMYDFKWFAVLSSMLPISSVPKTSVNSYAHNPGSVVLWGVMESEQYPMCLQVW